METNNNLDRIFLELAKDEKKKKKISYAIIAVMSIAQIFFVFAYLGITLTYSILNYSRNSYKNDYKYNSKYDSKYDYKYNYDLDSYDY